jgi:hypothetical protein
VTKPYVRPFVKAPRYGVYSEVGISRCEDIMFPGNSGIGTDIEAAVNSMKKLRKIAVALMFVPVNPYIKS